MSEPSQPSVPPAGHLPATPQYPAAGPYPVAGQYPAAPPYSAAAGQPAAPPHATTPTTGRPAAPAYSPTPGYGAPPHAFVPQPAGTPAGSALGRIAFAIAVVMLALGLVASIARPFLYITGAGMEFTLVVDNVFGVISFFVYAVALALAVTAARRPGSRLLAGIAIGIAGAGMIGLAASWVSMLFYRFF